MRNGRRLGIDVGEVRIGVAICDPAGVIATPVETVAAGPDAIGRLVELAATHAVIECVVGLPLSLSGRESHAAGKARAFANELDAALTTADVRLFDERMSTLSADSMLRERGKTGRQRRTVIDQAAATLILQTALDAERTSGAPPGEMVTSR